MTDQEIVKGLIERDGYVTEDFFFVKCKPLFCSIMNIVTALPDNEKEYDRIMAFNTIKLVKKLGYDIVKRNQ